MKNIIIKIGSSSIAHDNGTIKIEFMKKMAKEISTLRKSGFNVILVTSGAIAASRGLNLETQSSDNLRLKQFFSSVGQPILMNMYREIFEAFNITVSQILLTSSTFEQEDMVNDLKNTIKNAFSFGVLPIINENDAISHEQIKIGDNDTLGGLVSTLFEESLYVMITDVEGLYDSNPNINKDAELISEIKEITSEIEEMISGPISEVGTGGMITKINGAKLANKAGNDVIICSNKTENLAHKIINNEKIGTRIISKDKHE